MFNIVGYINECSGNTHFTLKPGWYIPSICILFERCHPMTMTSPNTGEKLGTGSYFHLDDKMRTRPQFSIERRRGSSLQDRWRGSTGAYPLAAWAEQPSSGRCIYYVRWGGVELKVMSGGWSNQKS